MPFNGSGVFQRVRNWVADATAGIKIRADYHDAEDDGFATGLSNCITKDGQTLVTQNIPWNAKRITGLEDPVNDQDAATKKYADVKFGGGGTMTGDLEIEKDNPTLILNDTEGDETHPNVGSASIIGQVDGKNRWVMRVGNDTPETLTDNSGSDFDLYSYANDGTQLGHSLVFNRASRLGVVAGPPVSPFGIATKNYVDARVLKSGDTMTGQLTTATGTVVIGQGGGMGTLEVRGTQAGMTFHIPSLFASNFGMDAAGDFYMGGYSHGANVYKFWTTRDFAALPTLPANVIVNGRLSYAGDIAVSTGPQSSSYEPYAGGVITGWQWAIVGYSTVTAFRLRYMQLYSTTWYTVGYA